MAKDAKWYAGWVRNAYAQTAEEKQTNLEAAEFIEHLAVELENQEIKRDAMFEKAEQLECERDFLLGYLENTHMAPCDICKHEPETHDINDCAHIRKVGFPCFEWRGLPEV